MIKIQVSVYRKDKKGTGHESTQTFYALAGAQKWMEDMFFDFMDEEIKEIELTGDIIDGPIIEEK